MIQFLNMNKVKIFNTVTSSKNIKYVIDFSVFRLFLHLMMLNIMLKYYIILND